MKSFLLILAICSADGTECLPAPEGTQATVFEYPRLVECVRAEADFEARFGVEAHCASDERSPADLLKG